MKICYMTDLVSLFLQKQVFAYLPHLAVSYMLPEPHLFIYLSCHVISWKLVIVIY